MIKEKTALKISTIVLFLAGLMDIKRGFAHTFNVRYSAEHLAGIEPISDSLVLMGAFGISNFLTGFIYFLVIWKARPLAPYVLLLIPSSYFIGGMGMNYQNVEMESAFVGRYIMAVYLSICVVTGLVYLLSRKNTHRNLADEKV
jgi:hypothetical protein